MQLHPQTSAADLTDLTQHSAGVALGASRARLKKRLVWSAAIATAVLLLIFVPPLINANRYRLKIAQSMSASLGRPVHLDNVSLHLLPVPGLTLSNLVVSEEPAFGDEPTLRADSVEATLRLGSLWRRRVEFSSIRFIEPHVNLVRNAAGRWNLADVLLHASHVDTAPTVQRHAGPAPRFPYIEATSGRVNVKLSEEKLPFSISDADFALWLPSPQVWRVRLTGQPARTDININEPGVLRIEGDLQRAGSAAAVPVNLRATWHDAPMGEASRILSGNDMGWRGTLNLDAALTGTLGAAHLATKLTLGGLRRADFAAPHPLDLQITCDSGVSIPQVTATNLLCTLPDNGPQPLALQAAAINLQHPSEAQATVTGQDIPLRWALQWAALYSARVPTDLNPGGTATLNFEHAATALAPSAPPRRASRGHKSAPPASSALGPAGVYAPWNQWAGTVTVDLPPAPAAGSTTSADAKPVPLQLVWRTGPSTTAAIPGPALHLQPVTVKLGADSSVTLNAAISSTGYVVNVAGSASAAGLLLPARYIPQLGDGLDNILPYPPSATSPARVEFTCIHPWGAAQTCVSFRPPPNPAAGRTAVILPTQTTQSPLTRGAPQLAPRSLSPLDQVPALGGQPDTRSQPQPQTSPRL